MSKDIEENGTVLENDIADDESALSIEEAFAAIEEKIAALEDDDISLEESFDRYREGMELVKKCALSVERIEKRVKIIMEDGSLKDFAE